MKSRTAEALRRILTSREIIFSTILTFAVLFGGGLNAAQAAVAVDASSSNAVFNAAGTTTLSWSHTVGAGASRALFVGVSTAATNVGSPLARVTSVTYGSQTLTRVTNGFVVSPDLNNAVELFQLVNPTTGTNTITVNLLPTAANYVVGGSASFTGVNQAMPNGNFASATNALNAPTNSATVTVTDNAAGDLVLDVIGSSFNAQSLIPDAAQTRQWRQLNDQPNPPPTFYVGAGSTKASASSSVTMNWALQFAQNWALGAVAVKAVPGSTASEVIVGGRVTTAAGRAVSRATVTLISGSGAQRTARTNPAGYYRFKDVPTGATYIFEARSKQYTFNSKVITITEESNSIDFVANP